jgi:hypothetical protein
MGMLPRFHQAKQRKRKRQEPEQDQYQSRRPP